MKTCLLCGAESADDVATCPMDGEATWSSSNGVAAPEPPLAPEGESDEPTEAEIPTAEPTEATPKPRRARK